MEEDAMERYFIVTEQSRLHKSWFAYKENREQLRKFVKDFKVANGIEADGYYADNHNFYIVPTEQDKATFGSALCSPVNDGLRKFKKSTKIGKAWLKALEDADFKIIGKPMVILYFKGLQGRHRSRIFDQDGVLYCSLDPAEGDTPEGFVEMKASEFFKVVEDQRESA